MTEDWITQYVSFLEGKRTCDLFKRWAAIATISGALQRRVWILSMGEPVYPNLYIILCGPPASGKGVAIGPGKDMLNSINDVYVGSASLTGASLADELDEATVSILTPQGHAENFNALSIIAQELGVFLPAYDHSMLNILTDVYDCKGYSERRRGSKKRIDMPNAHLTILGGTTPAYLQNVLPENAWDEGFMSRTILVYGQGQKPGEITEEALPAATGLEESLRAGLTAIHNRHGRITWDRPALLAFNKWYTGGANPTPSHPKLYSYLGRRHFNLMKLCLIHAMSRHAEQIQLQDFELSLDLLLETEDAMPDAFKAMKSGGEQQVMKEAVHYLQQMVFRTQGPVLHPKLVRFLQERVPAQSIDRMIQVLIAAELIRQEHTPHGPAYRPYKLESN